MSGPPGQQDLCTGSGTGVLCHNVTAPGLACGVVTDAPRPVGKEPEEQLSWIPMGSEMRQGSAPAPGTKLSLFDGGLMVHYEMEVVHCKAMCIVQAMEGLHGYGLCFYCCLP